MLQIIDRVGYRPRSCVWEITRACNLNCAHCGTSAGAPRERELELDECVDLIHQLAALRTRLITLSGGEPTVRRDWPLIAKASVSAGIVTNMVTNGQVRDPEKFAFDVKDSGMANVGVSIDGDEATHDRIRKPGAFARSEATIRQLAREGIWVDVMVTVNQLNLDQLPMIYRWGKGVGAKGFRVQLGKPMGNQTHRDEMTLKPAQMLKLLPMLGKLARRQELVVHIGDSVGYYSPEERLLRHRRGTIGHWTGCYAGCQAIGIQSDGGIKGCLSIQPREGEPDRFVEGNVHDSSLAEIWFKEGAFSYNRDFCLSDLHGACATCSFAEVCRGGAKCVAQAFHGSFGCDPLCYHGALMSQADSRRPAWARAATAAAATMVLGLGGAACSGAYPWSPGHDADVDPVVEQPDYGVVEVDASVDADVERAVIHPDYGVGEVDAGVDAQVDADDPVVEGPDYGVFDAGLDATVDADDPCEAVDCSCAVVLDYGMIEPEPCDEISRYVQCCCEDIQCEPSFEGDYGVFEPPPYPQNIFCCPPDNHDDYGDEPPNDLDYGDVPVFPDDAGPE